MLISNVGAMCDGKSTQDGRQWNSLRKELGKGGKKGKGETSEKRKRGRGPDKYGPKKGDDHEPGSEQERETLKALARAGFRTAKWRYRKECMIIQYVGGAKSF